MISIIFFQNFKNILKKGYHFIQFYVIIIVYFSSSIFIVSMEKPRKAAATAFLGCFYFIFFTYIFFIKFPISTETPSFVTTKASGLISKIRLLKVPNSCFEIMV